MGFDGCDLSVDRGGHVEPRMASLDLTRAVESLRGGGIDVPLITTALTAAQDPNAAEVLGIAGIIKVSLFRPGHWAYGSGERLARLDAVRRQMAGLAALGRAAGISMALHNQAGDWVGAEIREWDAMIQGMDPRSVGFDFDIAGATATAAAAGIPDGAWSALGMALPRLKAVTAADLKWVTSGGDRKLAPCALGEGVVDFGRLAAALAKANFQGPISLHVDYEPAGDVSAIQRDLEFLRKIIDAAYLAGGG
jgi:sugar phosphate isomerase/epimerase